MAPEKTSRPQAQEIDLDAAAAALQAIWAIIGRPEARDQERQSNDRPSD
jgi:hypothetical protein